MILPQPLVALTALYPGGLPSWELLWAQNVLLVFVQLTTGATLYSQDERYARPLTAPARWLTAVGDRRLLVLVHVTGGLLAVTVNLAFAWVWVSNQGTSLPALLAARPTITLTTLLLTGGFLLMAVFGVSLYATLTPNTRLPLWRFGYALSRKFHRGLFVLVVIVLGYHVFVTPRVTVVWTGWVATGEPFGLLALALVAVWGLLAGQSLRMLGEWATGDTFTRWPVDRSGQFAVSGAATALTTALALALFDTPLLVAGVGALVVVTLANYALRSSPFGGRDTTP